ncbi:MAG: alanine--tRNA ligase [Candidatus Doudnabacteria bacterium]|nr:alanine--tRNA ligase [Candidatus Doudnabacteria bacterium]
MKSAELREKYLKFFVERGHKIIPSVSLVPNEDPSVLFTTAGMQPLIPYFIDLEHQAGRRLVNYQKVLRTVDIGEVGDDTHLTFFEMLGNWSLGDYWKDDSIRWSYEFLTDKKWLGLSKEKLAVSVYEGDSEVPKDEEAADIWKSLGIPQERVAYLGREDNWWGPPGITGPCGPDTEIFYWTGKSEPPARFDPKDRKWVEIWNNVFIQFNQGMDGTLKPLKQNNVDTGMGFERIVMILQDKESIFETDLFESIMSKIQSISQNQDDKPKRIVADHLRAATFLIADGVVPSNKDRGYILRRLIRRAVTYGRKLGIDHEFTTEVAAVVIENYQNVYPELAHSNKILEELNKEEIKFRQTLARGLKILESRKQITGAEAFDLFQTYGFPFELIKELAEVEQSEEFEEQFKKHQELSRTASAGQFKGGLASHSKKVIRLHTATHLLNQALREVLGNHVWQKGSNITEERTRFDFTHDKKMSDAEKQEVERRVNQWIGNDLRVKKETMPLEDARELGAIGVFGEKYADEVSVYTIFNPENDDVISREFCGGPHVAHTAEIGKFKIAKEEAVSAGVRRIKAVVEP